MIPLLLPLLLPQPTTVNDLAFTYAVEESIYKDTDTYNPYQSLINLAGDRYFVVREEALERLRYIPVRWLIRGLWSHDSEIRARCSTALRSATPCATCKGKGFCPFIPIDSGTSVFCRLDSYSKSFHEDSYYLSCSSCAGYKYIWTHRVFDELANKAN